LVKATHTDLTSSTSKPYCPNYAISYTSTELTLGAHYLPEGRCLFRVWAPLANRVEVHIVAPRERLVPLTRQERGYYCGVVYR